MDAVGSGPSPVRRSPRPGEGLEIRTALALSEVSGLGPARGRRLLDRFGSPVSLVNVLRRSARSVPGDLGVPDRTASELGRLRPAPEARLAALEAGGVRVVRYGGPGYPETLRHLHHPPIVLYLQGPLELPGRRAVAVVGTRRATEYGRRLARDIAAGLAAEGWWVVSGMARGIDGAAHRAALDVGGRTAGIVAGGVDIEYPASHRSLFRELRERGVLASEFPPGTRPEAGLFPRRNRIIAALARAVVVVQAGRRSGALITAGHALELGREVAAVPGPIGPSASRGVHDLLRDGAALVTSADEVLELVGERRPPDPDGRGGAWPPPEWLPASALPLLGGLKEEALRVWAAARAGPAAGEALAEASGLEREAGRSLLDRMVLAGLLDRLPGDRYELRPDWCRERADA